MKTYIWEVQAIRFTRENLPEIRRVMPGTIINEELMHLATVDRLFVNEGEWIIESKGNYTAYPDEEFRHYFKEA